VRALLITPEFLFRFHLGPNLQNIVRQIYDNVTTCGSFTTNVR